MFRSHKSRSKSISRLLAEGTLVGLCATQALDWISTILYDAEDATTREAENSARGYMHAYERGVDRWARALGTPLDRGGVARWGWRLHKTFGVLGGVAYGVLRRRYPRIGSGAGLAFGAAFFLLGDEVLVPLFRLTPGFRSFSWKVHARGALSHMAYGVAAELAFRAFSNSA